MLRRRLLLVASAILALLWWLLSVGLLWWLLSVRLLWLICALWLQAGVCTSLTSLWTTIAAGLLTLWLLWCYGRDLCGRGLLAEDAHLDSVCGM
jgi:hypothetical protein